MKKILSITITVILILALGVSVFAAGEEVNTVGAKSSLSYKTIAVAAISAVCVIFFIILLALKKGNVKNLIAVLLAGVILAVFVLVTDFQKTDDYYSDDQPKKENAVGVVKISIRCDTVAGKTDKDHIPTNGVILKETEFEIEDGDTVYDILVEATKSHGIQLETDGSGNLAYVVGINNIYITEFGDLSGWLYFVNGESAMVGCAEYELKDGDVIEWHYSLDFGEDLK